MVDNISYIQGSTHALVQGVLTYTRGYIPECSAKTVNRINGEFRLSKPENHV